jgi:hypothetical protein
VNDFHETYIGHGIGGFDWTPNHNIKVQEIQESTSKLQVVSQLEDFQKTKTVERMVN